MGRNGWGGCALPPRSSASLLIHEKRLSIVEIAEQMGHAPAMTSDTYGHVMRGLRGAEPMSAEE
jgi:hypothetical protein